MSRLSGGSAPAPSVKRPLRVPAGVTGLCLAIVLALGMAGGAPAWGEGLHSPAIATPAGAPAPTVETGAASAITPTSVTLNATVNPNGGEITECTFEYGTTTSYGQSEACSALPGPETSPVAVSASIAGLTPNTPYDFRIVAMNEGGTSEGSNETFTTPAALTVTTTTLAEGEVDGGYSQSLAASGGAPPYTWSLSAGSLPAGLHLNPSSGAIVGTPTGTGTSSFTVNATDSSSPTAQTATANLSITVEATAAQAAEYGQCKALPKRKSGEYEDANCQKRSTTGRGHFEWVPGPAPRCVAQKRGEYTNSSCTTKSSKPRKGAFERAPGPGYESKTGTVTIETPGLSSTLVCEKSKGTGEVTGPKTGVERITLTGCMQDGRACESNGANSTPSGTPGVIVTNLLGTRLIGPVSGSVLSQFLSAEHQPYVAEFDCEGVLGRTIGSLAGVQGGDVDVPSATSTTSFQVGAGEQALYSELSVDGGTSWAGPEPSSEVTLASNTAAARVEIKT